jgi:hypothetical protein
METSEDKHVQWLLDGLILEAEQQVIHLPFQQ